jgi:hypothetical protein
MGHWSHPLLLYLVLDVSLFFICFFGKPGVWSEGFMLAKQELCYLSHTSNPFYSGYFGDGILWTIYLGYPWTMILSSQAARVTGVSYWHPLICLFMSVVFILWNWVHQHSMHIYTYNCCIFLKLLPLLICSNLLYPFWLILSWGMLCWIYI